MLPPTPSLRVLVVDDNIALADSMALLLELSGAETRVCYTGHDGLAEVEAFNPDIIFLDIGMPGMDGLQVCRVLRADPRWETLPIIAQTGYGDKDMVARAKDAGFSRHLTKPVELNDLLAVLADLGAT